MATALRALRIGSRAVLFGVRMQQRPFPKRNLLSQAYNCAEAWKNSLKSPSFGDLSLSEFAVQIHEQLEKAGRISSVDINVFAHHFDQLEGDEDEAEFVEDILRRYNNCQESFPSCQSTCHALVRGYIKAGLASRLPPLLNDRLTYSLFPDYYTLNLLTDHFIKNKDYAQAVKLAHFSTMQEDFSDPINTLLSLYACTQFLDNTNIDDLAPPPKEESDGEEDWIKVAYIRFPYYDDHFDIKDQRFLLGKTMMMLSDAKSVEIPVDVRCSLRIIGAGLYHKFDLGLAFLNEVLQCSDKSVSAHCLSYFSESLQKVESRDADEPEVEIALRTVDDVIHKMLPTHDEKEQFISDFERVKDQLQSSGKILDSFELSENVSEFVKMNIAQHEQVDIDKQSVLFQQWRDEQEAELNNQLEELRKNERIEEMKKQIKELQEQEELLEYFEREEKIRLNFIKEDAEESDPKLSVTKI